MGMRLSVLVEKWNRITNSVPLKLLASSFTRAVADDNVKLLDEAVRKRE